MKQNPSSENIKNLSKKSPEELLKQLSAKDQEKVQTILQNKELTQNLLNSPQAKALIKLLKTGKGGK